MPKEHYVGAAAFEYSREFYRLASGDNGISITGANENGKIAKIPNYVGSEGHHRSEEHGSREIMWVEQNQTGCDVRPVGITNGNQFLRAEMVSLRSLFDELYQLLCPVLKVLDIENSFGDPAKETGHAILQNFAPNPEECSTGPQFVSQGQKVILVASGAVQQEECHGMSNTWPCRHELVNEAQIVIRWHRLDLQTVCVCVGSDIFSLALLSYGSDAQSSAYV
jgi:hypothetical protein